jgi:2-dehydro-3-deoxyphosphogluconate aldolase/(4S)-4-hydroxy-2-oxoglutarate aldolase
VIKACYEGGIRVFEYTNRGSRAQENYILLKKYVQRHLPEMFLGIGTIKDAAAATAFMNYNADFIVCPLTDADIGTACREKNVLWIPGCMTPTEIAQAERAGAPLVKLFPGELLTPAFVKAVRPLFPAMHFMPTGGVEPTAASMTQWLEAGVAAMGMGSKLIPADLLATKNYKALKEKVQNACKILAAYRQQ